MSKTIVLIAEKASVAKPLAKALIPSAKYSRNAYVGVYQGNKLVVTRSDGHLFALYEPRDFNPEWKKWSLSTIPAIMNAYELAYQGKHPEFDNIYKITDGERKEQLAADVKYWCDQADIVVGAQDPDDQGDLISHLVKVNVGYKGDFRRSPIAALDEGSLKRQFAHIEALPDESGFMRSIESENVRSKLDAFLGFILSRTLHLKAQETYHSIDGLLAGGRIQFPIIGLLGRREKEILNFIPKSYYNLVVTAQNQNGHRFKFSVDGDRIPERDKALQAVAELNGGKLVVTDVQTKRTTTPPPPPYKLDTLTTELAQVFDYSPKEVLSAAEKLYLEGLISYPRTDTSKITYVDWYNARTVLPKLLDDVGMGNVQLDYDRSHEAVFSKNDPMSGYSHFGYTPSGLPWPSDWKKGTAEWNVFEHIIKRFAMMFLPDRIQEQTSVKARIGSYYLKTSGNVELQKGWYEYARQQEEKDPLAAISTEDSFTHSAEAKGQSTKAPSRYTKADINSELAEIGKHLSPSHQHLKSAFEKAENPGLGSAATRSDTIEAVFNHKLATETTVGGRKVATLTKLGNAFFEALPSQFTLPDLFAEWENDFREIIKGSKSGPNTLDSRIKYIKNFVSNVISGDQPFDIKIPLTMTGFNCPKCGSDISRQSKTFKNEKKFSWFCIHCQTRRPHFRDAPLDFQEGEGDRCDIEGCSGHYVSRVMKKSGTDRSFKVLVCDTCRESRKGSFEWEYEPKKEFRGTTSFTDEKENKACSQNGCHGSYKTIIGTTKEGKKRFLITKCDACGHKHRFLYEKPELKKRPEFKGADLQVMDGEGSTCSSSCMGVMLPRTRKDFNTDRTSAFLQCDCCKRINEDSRIWDKEYTRPYFRGIELPKLPSEESSCKKNCGGQYQAVIRSTKQDSRVFAASICNKCGDMTDFVYESPQDKRPKLDGVEIKKIENEYSKCNVYGCFGLKVPTVRRRKKDKKPFAMLECDVCKDVDKNSFVDL